MANGPGVPQGARIWFFVAKDYRGNDVLVGRSVTKASFAGAVSEMFKVLAELEEAGEPLYGPDDDVTGAAGPGGNQDDYGMEWDNGAYLFIQTKDVVGALHKIYMQETVRADSPHL